MLDTLRLDVSFLLATRNSAVAKVQQDQVQAPRGSTGPDGANSPLTLGDTRAVGHAGAPRRRRPPAATSWKAAGPFDSAEPLESPGPDGKFQSNEIARNYARARARLSA